MGDFLAQVHFRYLDFDNVFSSLFKQPKDAAKEFATDPARWLGAFQG